MAQQLPEGTVTILFTDVVGSTNLTTRRGDEAARDLMRAHEDIVRRYIRDREGREVKGTGDGFMVAFTSARKAVACAVDIQRALAEDNRSRQADDQLQVRIGLNAGEVIREDADLFGAAVNAAARIAAKSEASQILVSETVKSLIGISPEFQFLDQGRFRLKGFPERWRLFETVWREEAPGISAPVLAERTPFVGREAERAELGRLLDQALAGQGALLLLGGEAGVGKTRLTEELAAVAAERGMLALTGHCYEMAGAPPYVPFVEMLEAAMRTVPPAALQAALGESAPEVAALVPELRRTFPDIPQPPELPPDQERRYLFNGVRDFLARASRAQPLLLVLDDLHWSDGSSLLLLLHIAQQLNEVPVLILGTYRDTELDGGSPLARALEELTRNRLAHRLTVKRLPETGVTGMLRALSGRDPPTHLAAIIFSETEGNPFFVEEVVKHLAEEGKLFDETGRWREDLVVNDTEVPESLRMVIERRLERLDDSVRRALTAAAVIGRNFSYDLLSSVSDMDPDALLDAVDDAERAQIIASSADGAQVTFVFNHELIRQTLLSGVSAARRQRLHLQAAKAMEQAYTHEQREHAPSLAYHLHEAGDTADPAKTAQYLTLAGDRALDSAAFEEALQQYQEALSALPQEDRRGRADLLYKRGLTLRSLARWEEALADWKEAFAAYERLGDSEAVGRISWDVCQQLLWGLRYVEALEFSQKALAALGARSDTPESCLLLSAGGLALSLGGFYEPADRMLGRAETLARSLNDRRVMGAALAWKSLHHFSYSRFREQGQVSSLAAEALRSVGDQWDLANALWMHLIALYLMNHFDEASRVHDDLVPMAQRLGHLGALMFAGRMEAYWDLMRTANIDRFESLSRRDLEYCVAAGIPAASIFNGYLGLAEFWRGLWHEAHSMFEAAIKLETPGTFAGIDRGYLFLVKAHLGDREGAFALLRAKAATAPPEISLRRGAALLIRMARARKASGVTLPMLWRMSQQLRPKSLKKMAPKPGRPATIGASELVMLLAEGHMLLGERDEAAKLYPLITEWIDSSGSAIRFMCDRLAPTVAGIAAHAGRQWDKAQAHYDTALRLAHELPHKLEQPEVRRFYAQMLIERDAPGDRDRARQMLTEAVAMYREIGMPKHIEMAETVLRGL